MTKSTQLVITVLTRVDREQRQGTKPALNKQKAGKKTVPLIGNF